ncbi:uncharacterized protein LOC144807827 [Lissotriton helveticus]
MVCFPLFPSPDVVRTRQVSAVYLFVCRSCPSCVSFCPLQLLYFLHQLPRTRRGIAADVSAHHIAQTNSAGSILLQEKSQFEGEKWRQGRAVLLLLVHHHHRLGRR